MMRTQCLLRLDSIAVQLAQERYALNRNDRDGPLTIQDSPSMRTSPLGSLVPTGDLSRCSKLSKLLDHFVGPCLQLERNSEAEHLGGLEINHQRKFDWCL